MIKGYDFINSIVISRTDNIGDVILTLPLAGYLKKVFPGIEIIFIGKGYTQSIIEYCENIDLFIDREKFIDHPGLLGDKNPDAIIFAFPDFKVAKASMKAGISKRIGTARRYFHWWYCNNLVNFTRKKSDLHEAQLNFKLLKPLINTNYIPGENDIPNYYGLYPRGYYNFSFLNEESRFKIIIHPKSKGSAREWPLKNYLELIKCLPENKVKIFITGTSKEKEIINNNLPEIFDFKHVEDVSGVFNLKELIHFIGRCEALVACSTGPLHIAAALGKKAVGIYPSLRPLHAGRWGPLGTNARVLFLDRNCSQCKNTFSCQCINSITPLQVREKLEFFED